jgi:CubicO group peptidase (beta-lactamase class C family)
LCPIWGQDRAPLSAVIPVFETYVEKSRIAEGIPGVVVVIVKDGKVIYLKGFGVKVLGQNDPVDEHTPFALASVTKNITNTLVARLVDQGKLDWKDKVTKYLPDFQLSDPKITQEMTIEDLLSHRSGLPGYSGDTLNELGWQADEITPTLKLIPIEGEFRKTYEYQNVIVGLVGGILEKVTGKPLAQIYEEEIFNPIGLTETRIGNRAPPTFWQKLIGMFQKKEPQPTFHDLFLGKTRHLPNGNPGLYTFPASSGIISTGQDLGKWLIFQLNKARVNGKELISEANLNQMRSPHVEVPIHGGRQFPQDRVTAVQYGMGWFIHDYMGVPMFSHMGGMAGTRSFLLIVPQDNLGIAVLTNLGGMRVSLFPEAIRNKFFDLYLNVKDEVDWAKKLREDSRNYRDRIAKQRRLQMLQALAPARDLNDYVGLYENTLYGRIEIRKEADDLILEYRDRPNTTLKHWNGNSFDFHGSDLSFGFSGTDLGEITFSDERGKAGRMMINLLHEGADSTFHRVG